jgi:hypothetical protein
METPSSMQVSIVLGYPEHLPLANSEKFQERQEET